ncbi:MAG TPA: hypothetical protein VGK67_39595 [Myxococcales bacterium]|jgi:hypothetical protein
MDFHRPLALPFLLSLLSCGSGLSSRAYTLDGGRPDRGYTACGEAVCVPGEYCDSATYSSCLPGCADDQNCSQGLACHRSGAESVGTCGAPGASDGTECLQPGGKCEGGILLCYFGEGDAQGTCRTSCGSSFDCSRAGLYSYECCPIRGVSSAACVPGAIAPKDGTCQ